MESRISRSQIVEEVESWLGVPFRHRGRNRAGVDCAGLVVCSFDSLGILPKKFKDSFYAKTPALGLVESTLSNIYRKTENAKPGDILLFKFLGNPCHVSIVISSNSFIHSYESNGKVIQNKLDEKWQKRFVAAYDVMS